MPNNRNRIIVLILGILVSFVLLEVSLRIVGIAYSQRMLESHPIKKRPDTFAILCLGDSFTKGVGAPQGRDYPAQLEGLFQKQYPGKKLQVLNRGVVTSNTAEILEKFDEDVNEVNPDMIILLGGGANLWNVYGYGKHLDRNGWKERLNDLLYQVKTFKLIKLFLLDCRNEMRGFLKSDVSTSVKSKKSSEAARWENQGRKCQREGRYDEAISWYKKQIESDPQVEDGYKNLIDVYDLTKDKKARRQVARKLVELNPDHAGLKGFAPWVRDEDIPFIRKYERKSPVAGDILRSREDYEDPDKFRQEVKLWVAHDIEEMIRRAQRRGIKVILQNYPSYDGITPKSRYGTVNDALREVAGKNSVLFVDHERLFEQLFLKGERKEDYFEPAKVHCNERGYGVMAKNIYCGIIIRDGLGHFPDAAPAEKSQCFELEHGTLLAPTQ